MPNTGFTKKALVCAFLFITALGIVISFAAFVADRYVAFSERLLDDPKTEQPDVVDLSDETMPVYERAIKALRTATLFAPMHAEHWRSQAILQARIDVWKLMMEQMGARGYANNRPIPETSGGLDLMKRSLSLDPSNPDNFIMAGQMQADAGEREAAMQSWLHAADIYPINSPLRYALAMHMLMAGYPEQAREQAAILARNDDSYRLDNDDPRTALVREQRTIGYEMQLGGSYLYRALEIVWRTSEKKSKAVHAVVPDNIDAREVARMFFEQKGPDIYSME